MAFKLLVLNDPAARYLRHLAQLPDEVDIVAGHQRETFERHLEDAAVVFVGMGSAALFRDLWPSLKGVRWVHSLAAGVEGLLIPDFAASGVPLTNSRGVFARSLAEFVIAGVLFFAKDLRRMLRNQRAGVWEPFDVEELTGRTMGIVGYGEIGRAAAVRARALGMRVIAVRRRVGEPDGVAEKILPPEGILEVMKESDYVVAAAPLTPSTRGMVGAREFAAMKPSAVFINVGRGPVVDEQALVEALATRRIRGAALDVFEQEPLPAGHPFWPMDHVLLSPHCADHTDTWLDEAMELFLDNFRRFQSGAPLRNVVDKQSGY